MTVTVTVGGTSYPAAPPYQGAAHVEVQGAPLCCGDVLRVYGGPTTEGHDTVTARAHCAACRAVVGTIVVQLATLFGLAEDRRVLQGRCRVY